MPGDLGPDPKKLKQQKRKVTGTQEPDSQASGAADTGRRHGLKQYFFHDQSGSNIEARLLLIPYYFAAMNNVEL